MLATISSIRLPFRSGLSNFMALKMLGLAACLAGLMIAMSSFSLQHNSKSNRLMNKPMPTASASHVFPAGMPVTHTAFHFSTEVEKQPCEL